MSPPRRRRPALTAALCVAAVLPCAGCYSGDALVERVRKDALRNRLEEIELGQFTITMPRDPKTSETVEVEMRVFGSLARYKQDEVTERLEEQDYLLRHQTLMAIRESTADDFTDPDLTALRKRLKSIANGLLEEPAIQSVGFHEIRFIRR